VCVQPYKIGDPLLRMVVDVSGKNLVRSLQQA
jgi:hypothetical protein